MLPEISKQDATWLVEFYGPKKGYRVDNTTFQMFLRAYNIMKNTNRQVSCFSCEGRSIAAMAKSMYEQYEEDIKKIAYPPKTRGRKKNAI